MKYQLYRLKLLHSEQPDMFAPGRSRPDVILSVLGQNPSAEFKAGSVWHLGNFERLGGSAVYFAIGRTSAKNWETYDEERGRFELSQLPISPYTHAYLDVDTGVLAIGNNYDLQPTTEHTAGILAKLLNTTPEQLRGNYTFLIAPIRDPRSLIDAIWDAFAVTRIRSTFHRPNPFDVEKDFQKPLEQALESIGGDEGKVDIMGQLPKERVVEVAESHASTGDDFGVYLIDEKNGREVKRELGKEYLILDGPEDVDLAQKKEFFGRVQDYYEYMRNRSTSEK